MAHGSAARVSQGCLREDLHVREGGLRSRGGASGQAAGPLRHRDGTGQAPGRHQAGCGLLFTGRSPASSGRVFGSLGASVSKLDVLSWLVCAPHTVPWFIGVLCLPGVGRTKAQLYSCSVPAFS